MPDGEPAIDRGDSLIADDGARFDYVLANPPFGNKSSTTITNGAGVECRDALIYERQDFWETTSNKQRNISTPQRPLTPALSPRECREREVSSYLASSNPEAPSPRAGRRGVRVKETTATETTRRRQRFGA